MVRLLYAGVSWLLQNEWVILKLPCASEGHPGPTGFVVHEELFRFTTLLERLASAVIRQLGSVRRIHPPGRFPHRLRAMEITPM
ncbi:MAG: hypothetical protein WCB19_07880 [Thermoplasmata archaeon]